VTELESLRLDKWLWAARFYKTRSLAADAINGGKVHIQKQRCKASKEVRIGTQVTVSKDGYQWEITILHLSVQRRPAKEAVLMYQESPESYQKRQQDIIAQRELRELLPYTGHDHKPNKKERRLIHRFKQV
jgi:ribosome-associated heat shock protein Hsp15